VKSVNGSEDYQTFLISIKQRIQDAQYTALKAVNKELIRLYWDMGKMIVEKQEKLGWGKSVIEKLSGDLKAEFPGIGGFSTRNLWNMRDLFLVYSELPKLQPMVAEISWTKNIIIINKCKSLEQKEFYLLQTNKFGWTKEILLHQIANKTYEKYLHNQTNFEISVPENYKHLALLAVKDEYTFDFLELGEQHGEKQLQTALIRNIRRFMLEMGNWYAFIGSQYRLEIEGHEYFIDLLLFHRKLKCLIAIELKVGEFILEYKGKMEFYLAILNEKVKEPDENDSIGIIICRHKNKTIVEYSLRTSNMPIGIATYTTHSKIPAGYQKYLPNANEIRKKLMCHQDEK
jgi:predicted nuclease of restriction endonuclease-like (RecB) superfamily